VVSLSHVIKSQDMSVDSDVEVDGEGGKNVGKGVDDAGVETDEVVPSGQRPMEPRPSRQEHQVRMLDNDE